MRWNIAVWRNKAFWLHNNEKNGVYRYSVLLRRAVCDVTRITVRMRRSIVLVLWDSVRNKCSIHCKLSWSYFYPTIVISYIWANVFIHIVLLWIGNSQAKLTMWFIHPSQNTHESLLYGIIYRKQKTGLQSIVNLSCFWNLASTEFSIALRFLVLIVISSTMHLTFIYYWATTFRLFVFILRRRPWILLVALPGFLGTCFTIVMTFKKPLCCHS